AMAAVAVQECCAYLVPKALLSRALLHVEELMCGKRLRGDRGRCRGRRHLFLRGRAARRPFTGTGGRRARSREGENTADRASAARTLRDEHRFERRGGKSFAEGMYARSRAVFCLQSRTKLATKRDLICGEIHC